MAHPKTGLVKGDLGALFSLYYTTGQISKQSLSFITDQLTCASFLMFILNSALLTALKAFRRWDPNMQLLAYFCPGRVLRHYITSEMRSSYWQSKPKLPALESFWIHAKDPKVNRKEECLYITQELKPQIGVLIGAPVSRRQPCYRPIGPSGFL